MLAQVLPAGYSLQDYLITPKLVVPILWYICSQCMKLDISFTHLLQKLNHQKPLSNLDVFCRLQQTLVYLSPGFCNMLMICKYRV